MFQNKNIYFSLFISFFVLFTSLTINAADEGTGTIKGKVDYCGKGGYLGMQVFIPGRQHMVLLGADGKFVFEGVAPGNYDINYAVNGRLVNENKNVSVSAGGINDLGNIIFCDDGNVTATPEVVQDPCEQNPDSAECKDADKDGVVASKDCDDNNAAIKPGAIELCDGLDNNCNGEVDENSTTTIANGIGSCKAGIVGVLSCNEGFSDCDKDPSNGCETDIYNDNENCGACGNECSSLDICKLGIC